MRTRIIGLAVWASVLAIVLFGVPLAVAVHQYAMQAERSELERVANAVSFTVASDVYDGERIEEISGPGLIKVAVYDQQGDQLGGTGPTATEPEVADALGGGMSSGRDNGDLVVAVPVTHDDDVIGAVRASAPESAVMQGVMLVRAGMAALAALAVAAAWLVGRRQARRLALPLEDLSVAARRLGEGDFSVRTRRGGIPEIDSVGSALNGTAGRLDDLLAREQAFSADASHQLRTPLAGLRLRLEAVLERPDHELRAAIAASLVDADRLETIIDELLALARNKRAARAAPIDLRALLAEMSPEWCARLALQERNLEMTIDSRVRSPSASTAAVRQILGVLIDNATVHGSGTVTVAVRESSDAVAIDVCDEGAGVRDPETVLFTRRADRRNGHGIGLPLARRLAEADNGRLELTQRTPPVFTLLLPSAVAEDPVVQPVSGTSPRARTPSEPRGHRRAGRVSTDSRAPGA